MTHPPKYVLCTFAVACMTLTAWTRAADVPSWPQFHGPAGDNISTDTGLLKSWPEGGPKLIGSVKGLGDGFATLAIADGRMYTAGNLDDKTTITAMDMRGNKLWTVANGPAWTKNFNGARGTPTIDGDRLYHENPHGDIVCVDLETHKTIWTLNIFDRFGGGNITWGLAESIMIDGNNVICTVGGSQTSVAAVNKFTGKTVWAAKGTGDKVSYATTAIAEQDGLRMVLAMTADALVGVNAETGDLLFNHQHTVKYGVNALKPIYHDGHVFISGGYGSGSALVKINFVSKVSTSEVWFSKEMDNHHGGVMLLDGYLYGAGHNLNGGKWICLDWKTGKMMYAEKGVGKGSVTYADGMLYTMSEKGKVGLVKPTPDGHELAGEFQLPKGGEGPTWAHPVVCGGRLYIRHGDLLFAYDVRDR